MTNARIEMGMEIFPVVLSSDIQQSNVLLYYFEPADGNGCFILIFSLEQLRLSMCGCLHLLYGIIGPYSHENFHTKK